MGSTLRITPMERPIRRHSACTINRGNLAMKLKHEDTKAKRKRSGEMIANPFSKFLRMAQIIPAVAIILFLCVAPLHAFNSGSTGADGPLDYSALPPGSIVDF